jgi:hypothetical protein
MKKFLLDTAERAVATYVEVVIGLLLVSGPLDLDKVEVALVGAIPAALAVVKAALASRLGRKGSAALLPEVLDVDLPAGK